MIDSSFRTTLDLPIQSTGAIDLVVVIVSWNVSELLEKCLASVDVASAGLKVHVVVVDNASSDNSVKMVRERFPDVELIQSAENLGFARANNLALRSYHKRARFILLLNPDTIVAPDVFRVMLSFMEKHPETGIAGCKVVKPDGTLDWPCKRSFITPEVLFYKALGLDRLFPNSPRFGKYQMTYLADNQVSEADSVVGAFMLIRAQDCMGQIGFLDESIFMYGEDLDYCYRAKDLGWKVFYVPTSSIVHYKGRSSGKQSYRMIFHWYNSTRKVYDKHIAVNQPFIVNSLVRFGFHVMYTLSIMANFMRTEKRVPGRQ
jgi:GT2 family glycosyltransferase